MYQNGAVRKLEAMKIVNIEKHGDGFSGICTENFIKYYRFRITSGVYSLIPLKAPDAVTNYQQFSSLWERIHPQSRFLEKPITVSKLSLEELTKISSGVLGMTAKSGTA